MAEKTIKELADEIGVSKTAINKKVTPEMRKQYFSKIGNRFVISEEGQKAIKLLFFDSLSQTDNRQPKNTGTEPETKERKQEQRKPVTESSETNAQTSKTESQNPNDFSETAIKIIDYYQKQLEQKDLQLSELHKLLDQQQQLTLQTNRQNELLQIQLDSYEDNGHVEVEPNSSKQKKWWKFWM